MPGKTVSTAPIGQSLTGSLTAPNRLQGTPLTGGPYGVGGPPPVSERRPAGGRSVAGSLDRGRGGRFPPTLASERTAQQPAHPTVRYMSCGPGAPNRTCPRCQQALPTHEFNASQGYCRPCSKAYSRAWHERNRERKRADLESRRRARGVPSRVDWLAANAARRIRWCKAGCGQPAAPRRPYCSDACLPYDTQSSLGIVPATERACAGCPETFVSNSPQRRFCSSACCRRASLRIKSSLRRARIRGSVVEQFDPREIFERDGWRCHLCRRAISQARRYPDPLSASLDHLVPLGDGGTHERLNVAAAHLRCNRLRQTGGTAQLRAIA